MLYIVQLPARFTKALRTHNCRNLFQLHSNSLWTDHTIYKILYQIPNTLQKTEWQRTSYWLFWRFRSTFELNKEILRDFNNYIAKFAQPFVWVVSVKYEINDCI